MSITLSVLIDTYNHEKYVATAIESVLEQEGIDNTAVEIVVVDDGSTDGTGNIVQSFGDAIRYYHKPNGGQASAFNMGIPLCRGDIICFLDGDDWWHEQKLRTVFEAFQADSAVCAVGHSIIEVDEVGGNRYKIGPESAISINFKSKDGIVSFRKFACCLGTSRLAVRRAAAFALLDIPNSLVFEADEYIFTLLPTFGKVLILPEALTYYRIHGGNLYQDSRTGTFKYESDPRLVRRAAVYECLSKHLPLELARRGCDLSMINLVMAPVQIEASRLKLMTFGGTRMENFRLMRGATAVVGRRGLRSWIVFWLSLSLAMICPPRWYFKARQTYANFLRQFRRAGQFRQ
jgi:glycosyltransferase involved in cell wall biosynthesis